VWIIGATSCSPYPVISVQEARSCYSKQPTSQPGELSKRLKLQDVKKLFEWMVEPFKIFKVRMAGDEVGEIHQGIAAFVNIKSMYNQATELLKSIGTGDTDESKLRNDILFICPHYDIL
jgi:hypothetical protein